MKGEVINGSEGELVSTVRGEEPCRENRNIAWLSPFRLLHRFP